MLILAFAIVVFLPAFYSWTSRLNQFFFFGRTVPAEFPASPAGRAIAWPLTLGWVALLVALASTTNIHQR